MERGGRGSEQQTHLLYLWDERYRVVYNQALRRHEFSRMRQDDCADFNKIKSEAFYTETLNTKYRSIVGLKLSHKDGVSSMVHTTIPPD